jgi:head-tail adaptor
MPRVFKQIGDRRNSVIIQSLTPTDNDDGSTTDATATLATVFASIETIGGDEYNEAGQQRADADTRIIFPWSSDYSAISAKSHQLLFGSRLFQIVEANTNLEEERMIVCDCKEKK